MDPFKIVVEHQHPTKGFWKLKIAEDQSDGACGTLYIPKDQHECPKQIVVTVTGG